jgi:cobalt-zinc-cadmium efflux system outer membrane protein
VTGGESAPYEPLQLRVFAVQARNSVTTASNSLDATWRQLVAAVGMPHMTRQKVAGSVDLPVPVVDYETMVTMLQRHSDLIASNARIASSGSNLRLQEAIPIPNVTLYAAFQHDDTTPLSDYSTNVQVSAPVPAFNRNQGNITSAHAELVRARQNLTETNNTLMSQLAENYNRYATSRTISESYRTDLLPDQVRVYRGVYDRFLIDGESIDFAQVVVAQQTLTQVVTSYLQSLSDSWMATVDLAELLQVDDLMTMDGMAVAPDTISVGVSAQNPEAVPPAIEGPSAGFEANSISATETRQVAVVSQDEEDAVDGDQSVESLDGSVERSAPLRSRRPRARMIGKADGDAVQ